MMFCVDVEKFQLILTPLNITFHLGSAERKKQKVDT